MRARVAAGVAYTRSRHRDPSPRRADRSTCDGPEQGAAGSVAGGQAAVSGAEQRDVHESSRYNALGRRRGNHARVSRAAGDEAGEVADEERRDQADDPRRAAAVPAQHTKQPSAERAVFLFIFYHAAARRWGRSVAQRTSPGTSKGRPSSRRGVRPSSWGQLPSRRPLCLVGGGGLERVRAGSGVFLNGPPSVTARFARIRWRAIVCAFAPLPMGALALPLDSSREGQTFVAIRGQNSLRIRRA
jgi:hypothetical protein